MWSHPRAKIDWKEQDRRSLQNTKDVEAWCGALGLPEPWGPYYAAPHTCFSCGERIVVYGWHGHEVRGDAQPPPPRPKTVCRRTTRESGGMTYWVNTCVRCGKTQGDDYLYNQGERPLARRTRQPHVRLPGDDAEDFEVGAQDSWEQDFGLARGQIEDLSGGGRRD